jgi:hypothetical protein
MDASKIEEELSEGKLRIICSPVGEDPLVSLTKLIKREEEEASAEENSK